MNALFLLIAATVGVDFTYEFNAAGQAEYTMTIESELVPEMAQGKGVRSVIPRAALGGRVLRLQVQRSNLAGLLNTVNDQPLPNAVSQGIRHKQDGGYEYVVQINPASIELFKSGRPIVTSLNPALDSASELIIIAGNEPLASFDSARLASPLATNRNAGPTPADPATRGDNQVRPAQFSEQANVNERISIPLNALQNSPTQPQPLPQQQPLANTSRRNQGPNTGINPKAAPINTGPLTNNATGPLANTPRNNSPVIPPLGNNPAPTNRNTGPLAVTNNQDNSGIPGVGRPNVQPINPNDRGNVANNVAPINNRSPLTLDPMTNRPIAQINQQPGLQPNNQLRNGAFGNTQAQNIGPLQNPNVHHPNGWSPAEQNPNNRLASRGGQLNAPLNPPVNNPNLQPQNPAFNNPNGQQNPQIQPGVGLQNIPGKQVNPNVLPNGQLANTPVNVPNPNWQNFPAGQQNVTQNPQWPNNQPNAGQNARDAQFLAALTNLAAKIDEIEKRPSGKAAEEMDPNLAVLNEVKKIAASINQPVAALTPGKTLTGNGDENSTRVDQEPKKMWMPFIFTFIAFLASLAANAFLFWSAWDYYEQYRQLADDIRSSRAD